MNKLILTGALLALAAGMAGCNTIRGFGKDLQTAGGVMAGTAEGVQRGASPATESPPAETQAAPATCQPDTNSLLPEGCATLH